ncbi:MAG: DUF456 domain-containing protein [Deltaproteobacteria bacterium]|nr:DUF456 domain-containing protein [Deltaproteobacteria bacterium]MBW2072538.1 DUF456 domain-containing protein [Deltaproteobacteria bacterium]
MSVIGVLGVVLLAVFLLAGLVAVVFGLPGTWIILASSVAYGFFTDFSAITVRILLVLFLLAASAEGIDFLAGVWGAHRYGGSRKAMVGALLGGLIGAVALSPLMFGLGSVVGALIGAFGGAFAVSFLEHKKMSAAARVGWGAFLGRVFATVFKGFAAIAMIVLDIWALFAVHN